MKQKKESNDLYASEIRNPSNPYRRIKASFMMLHNPLFMFGDLGRTLDSKRKSGMVLEYDLDLQAGIVSYRGAVSLIPSANISSMLLNDPTDIGYEGVSQADVAVKEEVVHHPMLSDISSAQIETPPMPKEGQRFQAEYKGKA